MTILDTRGLQMFVAVAQSLSFRQAAELLHVSQPPLSRAIKSLEERLGVRLLERNTHQVSLTAAGIDLLPKARAILEQLAATEEAIRRHVVPTRLRIGVVSSFGPGVFARFMEALEERLLPLTMETAFGTSPRLVTQIVRGLLDVAIIALPTETQGLPVRELASFSQIVAISSQHPLARRRMLSFAELGGESVYWFERSRQPAFFDHCHRVFRNHGFAPRFLPEPLDHHVLLAEVAAGNGVALLPESFTILRLKGVSYRPLREGRDLAVGIGLISSLPEHSACAIVHELAGAKLNVSVSSRPS